MVYQILLLEVTLCAAFGFIYGLFRFFRGKSALYIQMIVFGVGCAMLGRLFELLQIVVSGRMEHGFHVGLLGTIGSFLFFFTSNYGQMDSIVDDGSKQFRKFRFIGMIAPLTIIGLFCVTLIIGARLQTTIALGVQTVVIALASYYHLKHLVIPDVDYGLIKAIRKYNLMALIYAYLCMAEMIAEAVAWPDAILIVIFSLQSLVLLAFVPVLERGVKKWTT